MVSRSITEKEGSFYIEYVPDAPFHYDWFKKCLHLSLSILHDNFALVRLGVLLLKKWTVFNFASGNAIAIPSIPSSVISVRWMLSQLQHKTESSPLLTRQQHWNWFMNYCMLTWPTCVCIICTTYIPVLCSHILSCRIFP